MNSEDFIKNNKFSEATYGSSYNWKFSPAIMTFTENYYLQAMKVQGHNIEGYYNATVSYIDHEGNEATYITKIYDDRVLLLAELRKFVDTTKEGSYVTKLFYQGYDKK